MTDTNTKFFFTIRQIKLANKAAGRCWFSPSTLRFFGSRILSGVYGGKYFVTSERRPGGRHCPPGPRLYTVRSASPTGCIETAGEFQGHATAYQAKKEAKRLAALLP